MVDRAPERIGDLARWARSVVTDAGDRVLEEVGALPSHWVRDSIYRQAGMRLPRTSTIYGGGRFLSPRRITIGEYSTIGDHAILDGRRGLEIGGSVNLGSHVVVWTLQHDMDDPHFAAAGGDVVIEDYAWIASHSIILPGVRVGRGGVVGAGSVVTHDVAPYALVAGIPARFVRERSHDLRYRLGRPCRKRFA